MLLFQSIFGYYSNFTQAFSEAHTFSFSSKPVLVLVPGQCLTALILCVSTKKALTPGAKIWCLASTNFAGSEQNTNYAKGWGRGYCDGPSTGYS